MATRKKTSRKKSGQKSASAATKKRATRKKASKRRPSAAGAAVPATVERTPGSTSAPESGSLPAVFESLAAILAPYAHLFEAEMQPRMGYCLKTYGEWPSEIYFAGVQWTETGVYFHLFTMLRHPQLVATLGPELRGRMEGKVSFRFEGPEPELFEELAATTATALDCLRREGLFEAAA